MIPRQTASVAAENNKCLIETIAAAMARRGSHILVNGFAPNAKKILLTPYLSSQPAIDRSTAKIAIKK